MTHLLPSPWPRCYNCLAVSVSVRIRGLLARWNEPQYRQTALSTLRNVASVHHVPETRADVDYRKAESTGRVVGCVVYYNMMDGGS
jgi:hypothetical protein